MCLRIAVLGFLGVCCWFLTAPAAGQEKKEGAVPEKIRKEIVTFAGDVTKAMKKKDVDAFVKLADYPFCFDAVKIINAPQELRDTFTRLFNSPDYRLAGAKSFKVAKILPYKIWRPGLPPDKQKVIDTVLGLDEWVVLVHVPPIPGVADAGFWLMVGRRNGKMKLVGFAD